MKGHVAVAEVQIDASPARVWNALTDPTKSSSTCSAPRS